MTSKKTISPTMKLLKENDLIRITFVRSWSNKQDKFLWFEKNKGHFTVSRSNDYFTLEVRYPEDYIKIKTVLSDNGVEFEENFGTLINIKF